jgi:hypothetical protein
MNRDAIRDDEIFRLRSNSGIGIGIGNGNGICSSSMGQCLLCIKESPRIRRRLSWLVVVVDGAAAAVDHSRRHRHG